MTADLRIVYATGYADDVISLRRMLENRDVYLPRPSRRTELPQQLEHVLSDATSG